MRLVQILLSAGHVGRLALLVLSIVASAAAEEPKDFIVFVGMDVAVEQGAAVLPVVGASRGMVEVRREGATESVPMRNVRGFTTKTEPKISTVSLDIVDLAGERAYTTGNDPAVKGMQQQVLLMDMQASRENEAENALRDSLGNLQALQRAARSGLPVSPDEIARAESAANTAATDFSAAASDGSTGLFSGGNAKRAGGDGLFDAYDVSFRVSAPRQIEQAYAVLRLILRDPDSPAVPVSTLRFFPLPVIDTKPRKVTLSLAGLPAGFAADAHELHIFVGGEELATSLSSHRFEVSASEAHQFLVLRYVDKNRGVTVPVSLVRELLPTGLTSLVPDAQRSIAVDFSIDANGAVTDLRFAVGSTAPGPELETALRAVRFYPALVRGAPAASTGTFALSEVLP